MPRPSKLVAALVVVCVVLAGDPLHAEPSPFQTGVITEHLDAVTSVLITPSGQLITAGNDAEVYGWDLATRQKQWERGVGDELTSSVKVAMRADGELLAASDDFGTVTAWVRTKPELAIYQEELPGDPTCIDVSDDGHWIAAGCDDGIILLFDSTKWYADSKMVVDLGDRKQPLKVAGDVLSVAFSPDGKLLAATYVVDAARNTVVLGVPAGEEVKRFASSADALAFSTSGRSLCVADTVYDTRTWQPRYRLDYPFEVRAAEFSPDGKWLVTGGNDNRLVFWNADDGRRLAALRAHDDEINDVAISADGRTVATASRDGTARTWDAAAILKKQPLEDQFHKLADKPRLYDCWRLGGTWSEGVLALQPEGELPALLKTAEQLAEGLGVKLPAWPDAESRPVPVNAMMTLAEAITPQLDKQHGETAMELFQLSVMLNVFADFYDNDNPRMAGFASQVLPTLRTGLTERYGGASSIIDAVEQGVKDKKPQQEMQKIFTRLIREIDVYLQAQAKAQKTREQ
ncbi:MAG: hypothetical protein K2Y37_25905 [Pirellulales bacterium]|nr:hypothetical protein [Pirellulales bacterium]